MELTVERVFTKELLHNAAEQFGVTVEEKPLGDFENYIFQAYTKEGEKRVLRLTHSSHRKQEQIQSELDFLHYVGERGAHVARPHRSNSGEFVIELKAEDGSSFFASVFDFAKGTHVKDSDPTVWNEELFRIWGKTIGRLHRLTVDYPVTVHRVDWEEDERSIIDMLSEEGELKQIAHEIAEEIKTLPRTKDTFGLIHSDVHHGNFFYEDGVMTVFDFDDLAYHFFVHDLAMVLYYSLLRKEWTEEEKTIYARKQLQCLREGYETEHVLAEEWYNHLGLFMRLRDIALYGTILKKFNGKELPEGFQKLTASIRDRVKRRKPLVEL